MIYINAIDQTISIEYSRFLELVATANIDISDFLRLGGNTTDTAQSLREGIDGNADAIEGKEDSFSKNTAFNKNFGINAGEVAQGNDGRILNGQTAYEKRITGLSITGSSTKTVTITLADGTTVTGSFVDDGSGGGTSDGNDYVSGGSFNSATGTATLTRTDGGTVQFTGFVTDAEKQTWNGKQDALNATSNTNNGLQRAPNLSNSGVSAFFVSPQEGETIAAGQPYEIVIDINENAETKKHVEKAWIDESGNFQLVWEPENEQQAVEVINFPLNINSTVPVFNSNYTKNTLGVTYVVGGKVNGSITISGNQSFNYFEILNAGNKEIELVAVDNAFINILPNYQKVIPPFGKVKVYNAGEIDSSGMFDYIISGDLKAFTAQSQSDSLYPMTETSGAMVDTLAGRNGVVYGGIVRDGTKYSFNGTDSYVKIPDGSYFTFLDAFSIEVDVTFEVLDGEAQFIVSKREYTQEIDRAEWQIAVDSDNQLVFYVFEGGTASSFMCRKVASSEIQTGVEYRILAEYDGSGNRSGLSISLNGIRKDTIDFGNATIDSAVNTNSSVFVGKAGFAPGWFFDGEIRNLKFITNGS